MQVNLYLYEPYDANMGITIDGVLISQHFRFGSNDYHSHIQAAHESLYPHSHKRRPSDRYQLLASYDLATYDDITSMLKAVPINFPEYFI